MPRIAIVAAMEREVRPLIRDWRLSEKQYSGRRVQFYEKDDLVLVCGGIGADAARRAAEAVISVYAPVIIYSAGFAGALGALKAGDLLCPRRVINAQDGSSIDTGQGEGVLVSFAAVANAEQKLKLAGAFSADAVDMEASAVAQAAEARGVAFAAVKAISDEKGFALPDLGRFVSVDGQFRSAAFAAFVVMRPWLWGNVFRLARNSGRAARALCNWLAGLSRVPVPARKSVESSISR